MKNIKLEIESMKKAGFDNLDDFNRALALGIENKNSYCDYQILQAIKSKYSFHTAQQAHLFQILNRRSLPREKTLNSIVETLETENPLNWAYNSNIINEWYGSKFMTANDVEKFLSTDKQVAQIGIYYSEKKLFVNFSDKIIFLDGSNVAYNNKNKQSGAKPIAKNIELVVNELVKSGFSNIRVIYDSNLPHVVSDPEVLTVLEAQGIASMSPSKTEADDFLIKYAKEHNAYIVTGDTFKDWAERDPWIKKNIDRFRIGFMINDNIVKFSKSYEQIDLSSFKIIETDNFHGFINGQKQNHQNYRQGMYSARV